MPQHAWKIKLLDSEEPTAERRAVREVVLAESLEKAVAKASLRVPSGFDKGSIHITYAGEIEPPRPDPNAF